MKPGVGVRRWAESKYHPGGMRVRVRVRTRCEKMGRQQVPHRWDEGEGENWV